MIGIYVSFLLVSLVPVLIDLWTSAKDEPYRKWGGALFTSLHTLLIIPIVTILCILAIVAQIREISSRQTPGALSAVGLGVQAIVFGLVAVSWLGRLPFPWGEMGWKKWVVLVGWVTVDTAIFAVGQAVLFWLVIRRGRIGGASIGGGEREPLISG